MKLKLAPDYRARSVTEISPEFLSAKGIKALVLDLDGNLAGYRQPAASREVAQWVAAIGSAGIRMCIVSNPGRHSRLADIAKQLDMRTFRGFLPKPFPLAFRKARRFLGVRPHEIAMVGDQIFTDILGGNLAGMHTVWVEKVEGHKEGLFTRKVNRRLERVYGRWIAKRSGSFAPYVSSVS